MPDLRDGESVSIQGSARAPYIIKNVGGVYSCSCPAWRNQSLGIERRSCKHIRSMRGEAAEEVRTGQFSETRTASRIVQPHAAPALLLAESWDNTRDVTGWWLSEKLDGVRAWFDGTRFWSRQGNVYHAPAWFTAGLPKLSLDGELWLARKAFQRTVSIVRRHDESQHWREIQFVVFDAPAHEESFEKRQEFLTATFQKHQPQFASVLSQEQCTGIRHLESELARIEALGGEGLMLRQPGSRYEAGRSPTLLKLKSFHEADARVVAHQPGRGRHCGRLGALLVELPSGVTFSVGTGFTDAQREDPPCIGSLITARFQELTDRCMPLFPSFVRVRTDVPITSDIWPLSSIVWKRSRSIRPKNRTSLGRQHQSRPVLLSLRWV